MRSLDARLRRMEKERARDRPCRCGGPWRLTVFDNVEPPPHPCPRCGTFGKRIVLMDDPGPVSLGGALAGVPA